MAADALASGRLNHLVAGSDWDCGLDAPAAQRAFQAQQQRADAWLWGWLASMGLPPEGCNLELARMQQAMLQLRSQAAPISRLFLIGPLSFTLLHL